MTIFKLRILYLISHTGGITGTQIADDLNRQFPGTRQEHIQQALSELTQSNEIERIEYQLRDNRSQFLTFYLPQGSRLV